MDTEQHQELKKAYREFIQTQQQKYGIDPEDLERLLHQPIVQQPTTYAEAGVDRLQEEKAVMSILDVIKSTHQGSGVLPEGHYAGGIQFHDGILSLATDGVGTKVLLAQELNIADTIGIDCVAMNVNDLIATGSHPLAFVDYIAIRYPDDALITNIVEGLAQGCIQAEIPLVGGETAIMPEVIAGPGNGYDVAGTALGFTQEGKQITGDDIRPGDVILGVSSSGIHSNGLTLARKIFHEREWKEQLLKPTRIYVKMVKDLLQAPLTTKAMAHITGGGFTNLMRLGDFHYNLTSWAVPELFLEMQQRAGISDREMFRTFNMGIGYIVIVPEAQKETALELLNQYFPTFELGHVENGKSVSINSLEIT